MTREQYEQHKQRLDEQLQAGIRLLESAHQAQVRALDVVWMLQAEGTVAAPVVPSAPRRPGIGELEQDLLEALPRLPERFTRGDVCEALGYEPDRGTLYRLLQELAQKGTVRIEFLGSGRRATVYRRTDG